jgi:hypothetical protein
MQRPSLTSPQSAFQQLRHTLGRALRNIVVFGLIGLIVGAGATEAVAALLTGAAPGPLTHIAAAAVGVLLGYAIGVSIAFRALLVGMVETTEWVLGEVQRLLGGAVHEAESVLRVPQELAREAVSAVTSHESSLGGPVGGSSRSVIGGIKDQQ